MSRYAWLELTGIVGPWIMRMGVENVEASYGSKNRCSFVDRAIGGF